MPSMQDMIDELNDIECPSCPPVDQCCSGFGNCGNFGCGFGSWIWILLILFYAGQGGTANTGCCCGNTASNNCCCNNSYNNAYNNGSFCGGGYLFLLVILFLCNGTFGCGNNGFNTNCNGSLL